MAVLMFLLFGFFLVFFFFLNNHPEN